jgi:GT2 family glycosyltransferase
VPSIIVPARNNGEFTATCLGALLHSVDRLKLSCEFILIDDASVPEDRLLDVFQKHRSQAKGHQTKIIRAKKHQHYTGVFSAGLQLASRDVIFFISNDMFITASFLQVLLLVSSLSREFGIVRGTSNHADSHPEHTVVPQQMPKTYKEIDDFSRGIYSANACRYEEDQVLSGDAILVKRDLVDRIGVMDLRFFGYFGDIDYGMRAHLAGFKLVCAKGAWLYHEGAGHVKAEQTRRPDTTFEELHRRRMQMVNVAYQEFRKKWHIETPADYSEVNSVYYFGQARANASQVPLKYDHPDPSLSDFEIY